MSQVPEEVNHELSTRKVTDLPVEILSMIFKYLDSNFVATSVLPVCKYWYDVGRNPILWKEVTFGIKREFSKSIETSCVVVVQRASLLRKLAIAVNGEVSSILTCVGKSCPLLEVLFLINCSVARSSAVQSLVSGCRDMKHLHLQNTSGYGLRMFAKLKTLRKFEMDYVDCPGDGFLRRLSENNRQLERVNFNDYSICRDICVIPLLANLKNVLKEVSFTAPLSHRMNFGPISHCVNLQSIRLNLFGAHLDEDLKLIENLKNLTRIHLEKSFTITETGWRSFISNVCADHIEFVCFEHCLHVRPVLLPLLTTRDDTILHRTKTLDLSHCGNISDNVLSLLLSSNHVLKRFSLRGCRGFKGYAFNTTDTSKAPVLQNLDVTGCFDVRMYYLDTFRMNRPGLKIQYPNGEDK